MGMYEDRFKKPQKQYTAEEVMQSAVKNKVWETLNKEDVDLIKNDPNAGMRLVNYKIDYINAPEGETGDYARGIARAGAEFERRQYGGYTTNADGSVATPVGGDKPTGVGAIKMPGTANGKSANNDMYKSYEKALLDAQAKAQENVYGMVAASTGGNASSSAVTKAAAAGADFSQLLADRKAEFDNQQYNRDLNEAQLAAQLGDFSKLRAMGIDTSSYEADIAATKAKAEREEALSEALTAMQIGDYSKLAALGFDTSYLEQIKGDEAAQKKLSEAITLATSLGIYGPLEALGYDTTWLKGKQGDGTEPKLDLNSALALKEAGYSSPEIEAAIKYYLGEGYTYSAPVQNLPYSGEKAEIENNPFDFSVLFENLQSAGAKTYQDAYNYALIAGYKEDAAKAIAQSYGKALGQKEVTPGQAFLNNLVSVFGAPAKNMVNLIGTGYDLYTQFRNSSAVLAAQNEVKTKLAEGASEEEIRDYLIELAAEENLGSNAVVYILNNLDSLK